MTFAELIWIGTSAIGALAAILGVYEAQQDRRALREVPRNGRHLLAGQQLFRQLLRLGIFVLWTAAPFLPIQLLVAALIGANLLLILATSSDLYVGAILRRMYGLRSIPKGD